MSQPKKTKQVSVLLRMVKALGKCIDVIQHRPEQLEVRLDSPLPDSSDQVEHPMQHGGERSMLVEDHVDGGHGTSLMFDPTLRRQGRPHARSDHATISVRVNCPP